MEHAPHPEGQREDYLFFSDGGQTFKALTEQRLDDKNQPILVISIAPVDAAGKALRLENGEPDVLWHNHAFPDFAPNCPQLEPAAIAPAILADLAARQRLQMATRANLAALKDAWRAGAINLNTGITA